MMFVHVDSKIPARIGIHDFQAKIDDEKERMISWQNHTNEAAVILQSFTRVLSARQEYNRRIYRKNRILMKKNAAATLIQKRIRGLTCRRQCFIKRCFLLIKTMHPLIFVYTLTHHSVEDHFPWYRCQSNVDKLHNKYCGIQLRNGTLCAILAAENSVIEFLKYMLLRERYLVCRMQAAWKGFVQRRMYLKLHRERGWLRSLQFSYAIKIQRAYRSYVARAHIKIMRQNKLLERHKQTYSWERKQRLSAEKLRQSHAQIQSMYQLQYRYDRTMRQVGAPGFSMKADTSKTLRKPRSSAKIFCIT